jgi:hypothetical protein
MTTTYTYRQAVQFANSAGRDAGNRSAQRNGRKAWNEEDRDAAQQTCDAVLIRLGFGHLISD